MPTYGDRRQGAGAWRRLGGQPRDGFTREAGGEGAQRDQRQRREREPGQPRGRRADGVALAHGKKTPSDRRRSQLYHGRPGDDGGEMDRGMPPARLALAAEVLALAVLGGREEERRVGKGGVSRG